MIGTPIKPWVEKLDRSMGTLQNCNGRKIGVANNGFKSLVTKLQLFQVLSTILLAFRRSICIKYIEDSFNFDSVSVLKRLIVIIVLYNFYLHFSPNQM